MNWWIVFQVVLIQIVDYFLLSSRLSQIKSLKLKIFKINLGYFLQLYKSWRNYISFYFLQHLRTVRSTEFPFGRWFTIVYDAETWRLLFWPPTKLDRDFRRSHNSWPRSARLATVDFQRTPKTSFEFRTGDRCVQRPIRSSAPFTASWPPATRPTNTRRWRPLSMITSGSSWRKWVVIQSSYRKCFWI